MKIILSAIIATDDSNIENEIEIGKIVNICEAVFYARDLANSPPNVIDPNALANSAKTLEKMKNIHVEHIKSGPNEGLGYEWHYIGWKRQ